MFRPAPYLLGALWVPHSWLAVPVALSQRTIGSALLTDSRSDWGEPRLPSAASIPARRKLSPADESRRVEVVMLESPQALAQVGHSEGRDLAWHREGVGHRFPSQEGRAGVDNR